MKRFILLCFTMVVLFGFNACQDSSTKASTRVIKDTVGRSVAVPKTIERIISIDRGFAPQVLKALQKDSLLVATGGVYPRSGPFTKTKSDTFFLVPHVLDIPNVGWAGYGSYDFEKILELKPDLITIVAYGSFKENSSHQELINRLENEFNIPVVILQDYSEVAGIESINVYYNNIRVLGEISGAKDAAESLIKKLEAKFQFATSLKKENNDKMLFLGVSDIDSGAGYVYGKDYGAAALTTELLSIQNVRTNFDSPILGSEAILQYNPDVIALVDGPGAEKSLEFFQKSPIYKNINAVKNNRIYYMGQLQWWSDTKLLLPLKLILDSMVYYQPETSRRTAYRQYMKDIFELSEEDSDTLASIHKLDSLMAE